MKYFTLAIVKVSSLSYRFNDKFNNFIQIEQIKGNIITLLFL